MRQVTDRSGQSGWDGRSERALSCDFMATHDNVMDFVNFDQTDHQLPTIPELSPTLNGSESSSSSSRNLDLSESADVLFSETGRDGLEMYNFETNYPTVESWHTIPGSLGEIDLLGVKPEPLDTQFALSDLVRGIDWNSNAFRTIGESSRLEQNVGPMLQSFAMSHIAPPSLVKELNNSGPQLGVSPFLLDSGRAQTTDLLGEPSRKRRASEASSKQVVAKSTGHKRSVSNAGTAEHVSASMSSTPSLQSVALPSGSDPLSAKRQDRLMRNRAAALASRERKREHVTKLECSVIELTTDKTELLCQVGRLQREVSRLRGKLHKLGTNNTEYEDSFEEILATPFGDRSTTQGTGEYRDDVSRSESSLGHSSIAKLEKQTTVFSDQDTTSCNASYSSDINYGSIEVDLSLSASNDVTLLERSTHRSNSVVMLIIILGFALFASQGSHPFLLPTRDPLRFSGKLSQKEMRGTIQEHSSLQDRILDGEGTDHFKWLETEATPLLKTAGKTAAWLVASSMAPLSVSSSTGARMNIVSPSAATIFTTKDDVANAELKEKTKGSRGRKARGKPKGRGKETIKTDKDRTQAKAMPGNVWSAASEAVNL